MTAGNCKAIPPDPNNVPSANPSLSDCIQIWNGTITSIVYGPAALEAASGQRSVTVTFTTTESTVLIAWGGHIASQIDWGVGNSASAISGSPYHMRLLTLDDTQIGNQDRSLKASAHSGMPAWQDRLFIGLARSANDATDFFQIPTGRVVEVGTQVAV